MSQQIEQVERQLKIAEERNEKLAYQIRSKDEETERML